MTKSTRPFDRIALLALLLLACGTAFAQGAGMTVLDRVSVGRRIYEEGILSSGLPVTARLQAGVSLSGKDAACVKCHRVSGSGGFEGGMLIPPVSGPDLFDARRRTGTRTGVSSLMEQEEFHFLSRPPYGLASLGRALEDGVTPGKHVLSRLMPRYALNRQDLNALHRYLRQLSRMPSPGYDGTVMDFATVTTPSAAAVDRQGLVETLRACFAERYPEDRKQGMRWRLNVWELNGDPSGWTGQLSRYYAARPVFAVISGIGSADWAPVHRYCESSGLPCLFPTVDVPGTPEASRYNFYFSPGVLLEADIMARSLLKEETVRKPLRIVQLVTAGHPAAEAGAAALAVQAREMGITAPIRLIASTDRDALSRALADLRADDALSVWLTPAQLAALTALPPPPEGVRILGSGWLGDIPHAEVGSSWREPMRFVYPFDPPVRLEQRMDFNLRPWIAGHRIVPAREMVLGNALTACLLLTEGISSQKGVLTREKLIEKIENYPSAMGNAPAPQIFHGFNLGPGQRFSAKGAFIVRLADPTGNRLEPIGDLMLP